jgi:hypothetical protein
MPTKTGRLIQVVPALPPAVNGVGDYAWTLANAFGERESSAHVFVVCDPGWQAGDGQQMVRRLRERTRAELLRHLSSLVADNDSTVLLHYVGYGYAGRGAPFWLIRALDAFRRRWPAAIVAVYFHELFALGPPWTSSFWLTVFQRHITAELTRLCDLWVTNRQASADWLLLAGPHRPHAVLPVFSNIGEPLVYNSARQPKAVVFGGAGLRHATYTATGDALFKWAAQQCLEIHDVGPQLGDSMLEQRLAARGVRVHGRLEPQAVSSLLSDASFGVVAYPVPFIAKSGVFAAYCSHGVCPVVVSHHCPDTDGLINGHHYISWAPQQAAPTILAQTIGMQAFEWYKGHDLRTHSSILLKAICGLQK